jgi:hypothetical protein
MSYLLAAVTVAAVGALPLLRHRRKRTRLYRELASRRQALTAGQAPCLAAAPAPASLRAEFADQRIVRVEGFLSPDTLARLRGECMANQGRVERSHIPAHKKGGTLSYEAIHRGAPGCLALYHSTQLRHWLSDLMGISLQPTADHDQSSCSLLYYDRTGDHIGWHYDHNFYRGRHFTILISLINRSSDGACSASMLQRRQNGETQEVAAPENTLVVFEGARVFHRATAVQEGDQRVMLSMTMCTDPHIGLAKELVRRVKDTAYYGPRILID